MRFVRVALDPKYDALIDCIEQAIDTDEKLKQIEDDALFRPMDTPHGKVWCKAHSLHSDTELAALQQLQGLDNVTVLYAYITVSDSECVILFMEYVDHIPWTVDLVTELMDAVEKAMAEISKRGVFHCDLHGANILVERNTHRIVIIDYEYVEFRCNERDVDGMMYAFKRCAREEFRTCQW